VHEALAAAAQLDRDGIDARLLDLYSIKPIHAGALAAAAGETAGIVVAEDHWPEGGLGDAVLAALAERDVRCPVRRLAVRDMPLSGRPAELLHAAGIDADAIAGALGRCSPAPPPSRTEPAPTEACRRFSATADRTRWLRHYTKAAGGDVQDEAVHPVAVLQEG